MTCIYRSVPTFTVFILQLSLFPHFQLALGISIRDVDFDVRFMLLVVVLLEFGWYVAWIIIVDLRISISCACIYEAWRIAWGCCATTSNVDAIEVVWKYFVSGINTTTYCFKWINWLKVPGCRTSLDSPRGILFKMMKFRSLKRMIIKSACCWWLSSNHASIWMLIFIPCCFTSKVALGRLITNATDIPCWYISIASVSALAILSRWVKLHGAHLVFWLASGQCINRTLWRIFTITINKSFVLQNLLNLYMPLLIWVFFYHLMLPLRLTALLFKWIILLLSFIIIE